jgi:predicted nucleic acid-binding protein
MPRSVFVDTSGWYALIDRQDARHTAVVALVQRFVRAGTRLVTTDYVIDESCTLAKARAGSLMAFRLLDLVRGTEALDLEWIGSERFDRSEAELRKYHDQAFSFTDCTSFAVMREMRIAEVITTDAHFRIAGFRIVPEDAP